MPTKPSTADLSAALLLAVTMSPGCFLSATEPPQNCSTEQQLVSVTSTEWRENLVIEFCARTGTVVQPEPVDGPDEIATFSFTTTEGNKALIAVIRDPTNARNQAEYILRLVRSHELYGLSIVEPPLATESPIVRDGEEVGTYVEGRDSLVAKHPAKHYGAFAAADYVVVFDLEYSRPDSRLLPNILAIRLNSRKAD